MLGVRKIVIALLCALLLASCGLGTPAVRYERPWPEVVAEAYRLADEQGFVDPFIGSVGFGYDAYDVPDNVAKHVDRYVFFMSSEQKHEKIEVDMYSTVKPSAAFNPLSEQEIAALQSGRKDDAIYRLRISPNTILEKAEPLLSELSNEAPLRSPPHIGIYTISIDNSQQLSWKLDASNNISMLRMAINAETGEILSQELVPEISPIE
jgi:hypothetical protein